MVIHCYRQNLYVFFIASQILYICVYDNVVDKMFLLLLNKKLYMIY